MRRHSSDWPRARSQSTGQRPPPPDRLRPSEQEPVSPSDPVPASPVQPPARPPLKPSGPKTFRSRHLRLGIDPATGSPGVELSGQAALALHARVQAALLERLQQAGEPPQGWPAANELIELFSQFGLPPALCLSLIQDPVLWDLLCAAQGRPRRTLAAVIAALLRLGETGLARHLLTTCPAGADRRVLVRRLLQDTSQPLQPLQDAELRGLIDAVFNDMLKKGLGQHENLLPLITTLRQPWRGERRVGRPLETIEAELAQRHFFIWRDSLGQASIILGQRAQAEPGLLNLVLECVAAALENGQGDLALDLLFNGLDAFGLHCGNGRSVHLRKHGEVQRFQAQCRRLESPQTVALTAFVRQACALLFAAGQTAAIESLIRASLWLRDPLIRTDPSYQAAALQAVVEHGCAGLWLLTQRYTASQVSTTLCPTLLKCLSEIVSPRAALRFIEDVLRFLDGWRQSMGLEHGSPQAALWIDSRDELLDGLVHAIAPLVKQSAQWPSVEGETLAQWAWVTATVMELLRRSEDDIQPGAPDLAYYAPCLAHFQVQAGPFALMLKLLACETSLAQTAHLTLERMRDLFKCCPIEVQSVVLHWPLACLWNPRLLWRAIKATEVLNPGLLSPQVQLVVLQDLLDERKLLPTALAPVLSGLLAQPGFGQLVAVLQTRPEMNPLAWDTLLIVCERNTDAAHWRPGLPALLRWLQEAADPASVEDTKRLWTDLALSTLRLRRTPGASDKDLRDIGVQLRLSTDPATAAFQLDTLIDGIADPQITAPVLRGWILHRIDRLRETGAPLDPAEARLLKAVLARYGALLPLLDNRAQTVQLQGEYTYLELMRKGGK